MHGIQVWLEEEDHQPMPLTEIHRSRSEVSAVVITDPGKPFSLHWCREVGHKPLSTWCEIYMIDPNDTTELIAKSWMNESDPETQSRELDRQLEQSPQVELNTGYPIGKNRRDLDSIRLDMRRIRGEMLVECTEEQCHLNRFHRADFEMDLIDDPSEGKNPWISFIIKFQTRARQGRHTTGSSIQPDTSLSQPHSSSVRWTGKYESDDSPSLWGVEYANTTNSAKSYTRARFHDMPRVGSDNNTDILEYVSRHSTPREDVVMKSERLLHSIEEREEEENQLLAERTNNFNTLVNIREESIAYLDATLEPLREQVHQQRERIVLETQKLQRFRLQAKGKGRAPL
ncbi:hypothetical protein A0H81_10527 [Grifola frondosa]|uniref:Uncharacterized protein n=1 Tax=Grifola frondosa TaxID=5627 RepID=A0A1C7M0B6_GRIFR|nr:hypothetical protein A0H81_10527 [Grifola frondosa]